MRLAWKAALLVAVLVGASFVGGWVADELSPPLTPSTEPLVHRTIMIAVVVYGLMMMLPFVPGVEIGLAIMALLGPSIVPLVYGVTVVALVLAFLVGRLVPQHRVAGVFEIVRLRRAAALLRELAPLQPSARLEFLLSERAGSLLPFMLRHRYLALILLLNIPGNIVIGGGGGICLVAGFSRLFVFPWILFAILLAVLPVPLIFVATGWLP